MLYYLVPKLYHTNLASTSMANAQFLDATVGIILYAVSMWISGITQGLMWFEFKDNGMLRYTDWNDFLNTTMPYYWLRSWW